MGKLIDPDIELVTALSKLCLQPTMTLKMLNVRNSNSNVGPRKQRRSRGALSMKLASSQKAMVI